MKRQTSVTRKCRMLCPHGCGVQRVIDVGEDDSSIQLECSHYRGEILALQPGRISIEHLRQKIGRELFPAVLVELPSDDQLDGELNVPDYSEEAVSSCLEALEDYHNAIEY